MNQPSNPSAPGTPGALGTPGIASPLPSGATAGTQPTQLSPGALSGDDPMFPARIFSVLVADPKDPNGEVWQYMNAVPGAPFLIIVSIVPADDGGYQVFALPAEGTAPHDRKQAFIFTLSENIIRQTMTVVNRTAWEDMLKPAQEAASDEWVASLVTKWTGIPEDMIIEHLEEAREELEELENGDAGGDDLEPDTELPGIGSSSSGSNGTAGGVS